MRIKHAIMLFSLLACAFFLPGWTETWESIHEAAGTITSVETEFIQTKHLPILNKPLVSRGKLWYQAPGSLRWEYLSPIHSILLMHNGRVKRYTQDTRTGKFSEESGEGLDAMQMVLGEISQWLAGRFDRNPMFAARLKPEGEIVLTPREKAFGDVIQRIEVYLYTKPGQPPGMIRRVLIFESETAYTELDFKRTRLNQTLDNSVFQKIS